jgi:hypothetical protein
MARATGFEPRAGFALKVARMRRSMFIGLAMDLYGRTRDVTPRGRVIPVSRRIGSMDAQSPISLTDPKATGAHEA